MRLKTKFFKRFRIDPKLFWVGIWIFACLTTAMAAQKQNPTQGPSPYRPFGNYDYTAVYSTIDIGTFASSLELIQFDSDQAISSPRVVLHTTQNGRAISNVKIRRLAPQVSFFFSVTFIEYFPGIFKSFYQIAIPDIRNPSVFIKTQIQPPPMTQYETIIGFDQTFDPKTGDYYYVAGVMDLNGPKDYFNIWIGKGGPFSQPIWQISYSVTQSGDTPGGLRLHMDSKNDLVVHYHTFGYTIQPFSVSLYEMKFATQNFPITSFPKVINGSVTPGISTQFDRSAKEYSTSLSSAFFLDYPKGGGIAMLHYIMNPDPTGWKNMLSLNAEFGSSMDADFSSAQPISWLIAGVLDPSTYYKDKIEAYLFQPPWSNNPQLFPVDKLTNGETYEIAATSNEFNPQVPIVAIKYPSPELRYTTWDPNTYSFKPMRRLMTFPGWNRIPDAGNLEVIKIQ